MRGGSCLRELQPGLCFRGRARGTARTASSPGLDEGINRRAPRGCFLYSGGAGKVAERMRPTMCPGITPAA